MYGNSWFKRFEKECKRLSPHIRFKLIKYGFYRIYYKGFYIGECYKEMPPKGYNTFEDDVRVESQSYYEEYEDSVKMTRQIKNFVEGYYDITKQFRTRMYMLRSDNEFYNTSRDAYKQISIK